MAYFFVVFILMAVFAFIGSSMAAARKRDPLLWAILCALTGIVGVLVLAAIGEDPRRASAPEHQPPNRAQRSIPAIQQMSGSTERRPPYDVEKWQTLVEVDPEIASACREVAPYGAEYVDELATKYLTLLDKNYLRPIVNRVLEMARTEADRRAELAAEDKRKSALLLDDYLDTVRQNGGRDPDLLRPVKKVVPFSGAARVFEGEAIKIVFEDGTAMLRGRSFKRSFRDEVEADAWGI